MLEVRIASTANLKFVPMTSRVVEETEKGTRELRHSSPSGAFEHDAPGHNVHVTCHFIQVSVHNVESLLGTLSRPRSSGTCLAEESRDISGTKGGGVPHYRRKPRHEVASGYSTSQGGDQSDRAYGSMATLEQISLDTFATEDAHHPVECKFSKAPSRVQV